MTGVVPVTIAPPLGAIIVVLGLIVLLVLFTVTLTEAMPIVPPFLLYPLQTKVCVPSAALVEFHGYEKVNAPEFGRDWVASQTESTNRFSTATFQEFAKQVKLTVPVTIAELLGTVI